MRPGIHSHGQGGQPSIAIVHPQRLRQLSMQLKTLAGEGARGELSHQSRARNPPALPEAAQATPQRSMTVAATPRSER